MNDAPPTQAEVGVTANPVMPVRGATPGRSVSETAFVLPIGGGYTLLKCIGKGSFGEVWQAEAPGGFAAAVKVILFALNQAEAQRELQSLEVIRGLRHPYLVQTQAYWPHEERLYIVMELAEGSLRDRWKQCLESGLPGIPLPELMGYFREAAEALDYLHGENVHHRDIKPENILILKRHAKIADLGLARLVERHMMSATSMGTPAYMAPEVWGGRISSQSDQYSLALTFVELRLGRRLTGGLSNFVDLMNWHLEARPDLSPLPAAEQKVLLRALAKKPSQRFGSCLEFIHALEEALGSELGPPRRSQSDRTVEQTPPAPPPPRRRAGWAAATALALVLTGLTVAVVKPLSPPPGFTLAPPEPVVVAGGKTVTHAFPVRRDRFKGPIHLRFSGLPDSAQVSQLDGESPEDSIPVMIFVRPGAPTQTAKVTVQAEGGGRAKEYVWDFTILFVPAGFLPAGPETVTDYAGKPWFQTIAQVFPDQSRALYRVVPRKLKSLKNGNPDPETFYLMEDKVSAGQFRQFLAVAGSPGRAQEPATADDHPALGVTVTEAYQYAKWCGGHLPTVEQWDKAAGRFEDKRGEGPYQGKWGQASRPQIAVGRLTGPMKVGEARDDWCEPYRVRDTAGNGEEWTRSLAGGNRFVPVADPQEDDLVYLRGQSFRAPEPLRYEFLEEGGESRITSLSYLKTKPDVGFRVVIEP